MSEGLCWKCREFLEQNGLDVSKIIPSIFCHHEPKEKPKEKCWWCEAHRVYFRDNSESDVAFCLITAMSICPICGRSL